MERLWQTCDGVTHINTLQTRGVRIVESQEQIATMSLVDSSSEQAILEELLETSKPPCPDNSTSYHYLIKTPFRYPPLRYGSRFGLASQTGLFYASQALETALTECAYYRLIFLSGMETPPDKHIITEHTTFKVSIETSLGIALNQQPFDYYQASISNPVDYSVSQQLGSDMRDSGVQAFTYHSARGSQPGINIGIFEISAIKSKKPYGLEEWLCSTANDAVTFISKLRKSTRFHFGIDEFLVESQLPSPAT
ncbi:MAG: RES family NAD+ phosphorylase [Gammaproteobacteria bacterium]|nr:RES family NAD+ phosphorylase [Gammaproteobacteria bacterium]